MKTYVQYGEYRKPNWAPPAWLFAPVWTILYILIAVSFGYVGYLWITGAVSVSIAIPFLLNLVFNFLFTTIQFKLRNFMLAAIDVVLVWITLVWAMVVVFPIAAWVTYANIPYLAWVTFATVLQITITLMNRK